MNLGENIYRLRAERNLSQGDLADALEVSRQSVSKWENNSAVPELEKLIKMAQIFGITIDELVTGKTPDAQPAPPSPTIPQVTVSKTSTQKILGILLLALGGLALIIFTVVGIVTGTWIFGLVVTGPFLLCGTICLICKKNAGLWCAWSIFLPLWLVCFVFMGRGFDANLEGFIRCTTLAFGLILFAATLHKAYRSPLPMWCKVLITAAIALLLYGHIMGFLPVRTVTVTRDPITQVIVPNAD